MVEKQVTVVGTGLPIQAGFPSTRLALTQLIASARSSLLILTPYLDQDGAEFLAPLLEAAMDRDVRIVLIVRSGVRIDDNNVPGLRALSRLVGAERLDAGVELIQLVERTESGEEFGIHAKTIIVDESAAYVGSSNLTRNGLARNVEIGVIISGTPVRLLARAIEPLTTASEARHLSWRALAKRI